MDEVAYSRELLQAKLLIELMSQAIQNELVLKGGLAMRAVLGSTRYTADIDLDAVMPASVSRIQGIVRRSIDRVVKQHGLIEDPQVSEPKQTETTLRWKINGRAPGTARPISLTVEVSRREWVAPFRTEQLELNKEFAGGAARGPVLTLDAQALAVCKVLALTDPKRDAPRDLFDLSVLLETELEAPAQLLASQSPERLEQALTELWAKVESMGYERFKTDVVPYLPPETAAAVTEEAYEEMQVNVGTNVEQWLEDARELQKEEGVENVKPERPGAK
jgi:predicted nucleotidyltransferase component of viral defense system